MRLGVVVNPVHSRTHRAHHRLVTLLDDLGVRYRSASTTPSRPGRWQAHELVGWGAEAIVVLGGDGTLRSVAPVVAAAEVPLLVIPTGTANVFARGLGIRSPRTGLLLCEDFVHCGADRAVIPISVADLVDAAGRSHHEHFLSLAGIGGDAQAVAAHDRRWGPLGYLRGGAGALFARELRVSIDGREQRAWAVMASKTARPAGPLRVFPGAEARSESLEFLAVVLGAESTPRRVLAWARIGTACLRGHPEHDPAMRYWTGWRAEIRSAEPAPIHLDGDHLGEATALDIDTGELLLDVIVPVVAGPGHG